MWGVCIKFVIMNTREKGNIGEERAAKYLEGLGWRVLGRNFRAPHGEADIIAMDGRDVVAVEVKSLSRMHWKEGDIAKAVDRRKLGRIRGALMAFLADSEGIRYDSLRIDVIEIGADELRHYKGVGL